MIKEYREQSTHIMNESDIPANRIPKRSVYNKRNCEKEKCGNEGNYSSKRGYFCLEHVLDYDMTCPNKECSRSGLPMDKLVSEIKKDIKGELHQIFLCQSCGFRHVHTVKVGEIEKYRFENNPPNNV